MKKILFVLVIVGLSGCNLFEKTISPGEYRKEAGTRFESLLFHSTGALVIQSGEIKNGLYLINRETHNTYTYKEPSLTIKYYTGTSKSEVVEVLSDGLRFPLMSDVFYKRIRSF